MGWTLDDRAVCAALLIAAGLLFVLPLGRRAARLAWAVLLAAGLANACLLNLAPGNLINNNNLQQYLGAKYVFPYADFQALVNAARDEPQVQMRDLEHPMVILRADPRAERAYYIDLLRGAGVSCDTSAPLEALRELSVSSGALARESERVLAGGLAPGRIENFRRDVRAAAPHLHWVDITADYGFNGSPFYAWLRQADPGVHLPLGAGAAIFGFAWQLLALGLIVWILRLTFALDGTECLAAGALLLASWDFVGYALSGLTFAGLWLPVALAALATRRGRHALAGAAIAVAGLMKLFPFVLLLPSVVTLAASAWRAARRDPRDPRAAGGVTRGAWITLVACAATTLVLGFFSSLGGRSWSGFFAKITSEFGPGSYMMNSVSANHMLLALGVSDAWATRLISLAALALLAALCLPRSGADRDPAGEARLAWILLAATSFLVNKWLNYYALAPLFLLTLPARVRRREAAAAAILLAGACLLPEYDDPRMKEALWRGLKIAPYLLVPAWMVTLEFRERIGSRRARGVIALAAAACLLVVAADALRMAEVRRLERTGNAALDRGDAAGAGEAYARLLGLKPGHAAAEMNLGISLAESGRMEEAGAHFERAAALAPGDPLAVKSYGMWLEKMGRLADAEREYERVRALTPWDDEAWVELARLEMQEGRAREARPFLTRALELRPENQTARALLDQLTDTGSSPPPTWRASSR